MQLDEAALERTECRFRRDIWSVAPKDAVLEAGVQACNFGPVLATVFADLPEATVLNTVRGGAEPSAVAEGHLPRAVEWMREWEVQFSVPVAAGRPGTAAAERWLQERGFEQSSVSRKYVRAAARPIPPPGPRTPGLEVRAMAPEANEGLGILVGCGLELPELAEILFMDLPTLSDWHCYLARIEGEVAATGSMLVDGPIATLGLDATFPDSRRLGCQTALLERRLRDAAAAGCHTVAAEVCGDVAATAPVATHNLQRLGFVEAYRTVSWRAAYRPGI